MRSDRPDGLEGGSAALLSSSLGSRSSTTPVQDGQDNNFANGQGQHRGFGGRRRETQEVTPAESFYGQPGTARPSCEYVQRRAAVALQITARTRLSPNVGRFESRRALLGGAEPTVGSFAKEKEKLMETEKNFTPLAFWEVGVNSPCARGTFFPC